MDEDLTGDEGNEELLRSEDCGDDFAGFFLLLALGISVHAGERTCVRDDLLPSDQRN